MFLAKSMEAGVHCLREVGGCLHSVLCAFVSSCVSCDVRAPRALCSTDYHPQRFGRCEAARLLREALTVAARDDGGPNRGKAALRPSVT